ncbi:TIGR04283 family arsenosugar biosynthesis glycosyltransferase [Candidatus Woesearchaeota archaeon]|nr:TIGR04283 family arsenosugar biosynthesis glycosyltransferase [Candidatus Woesearchaeota archaeon]
MISIVIPVYNESKIILECLDSIYSQNENYEIIIVDSGKDKTLKKINSIKNKKIKYFRSSKGRSLQMNLGSRYSEGDVLLFLHADSVLPVNALEEIEKSIREGHVGGGFFQQFKENNFLLKLVSFRSNFRSSFFKIFFGDQAIFVKKEVFEKLGGFKQIPIMEDLDFSKRMKKLGKLKTIKNKITISRRKYLEKGIIRLSFVYFILMIMYHLGFSYEKIKKVYEKVVG